MKKIIITFLKKILPSKFVNTIKLNFHNFYNDKKLKNLRLHILNYYRDKDLDFEKKEIFEYLKDNELSVFPYSFQKKYKKEHIEVLKDHQRDLPYVFHQGKKLFFKRTMSDKAIKSLYHGLLLDQDSKSPHLYLTDNFSLNECDVIADIGCAEGNFSLSNIETVKKVYLFESDKEWIEALEATFEPWKEKIHIINKFVTNHDSDTSLNINSFYEENNDITFFKVDIEGEEQNFLSAAENVLRENKGLKIAICTYHKEGDFENFSAQLSSWGYQVENSYGYMIFIFDQFLKAPFLRRGLIRAYNEL